MKLSCGSAGVVSPRPALARIRALTSSRSSWHSGNDTLFDKRIESGCKWYGEIGYFEILFESRYICIYDIYRIYDIYTAYFYLFELVNIRRTNTCWLMPIWCVDQFWSLWQGPHGEGVRAVFDLRFRWEPGGPSSHGWTKQTKEPNSNTDVTSIGLHILYCGVLESRKYTTIDNWTRSASCFDKIVVDCCSGSLETKASSASFSTRKLQQISSFYVATKCISLGREGGGSKQSFQWFLSPIVSRFVKDSWKALDEDGSGELTEEEFNEVKARVVASRCHQSVTVHVESVAKKDRAMKNV